ncbi:PREDICTED: G-protein coupled receptor 98-like [Acropora digitifera]|uniref:G-protein coupled receptor 98-like n=1 Tax=Acropora digitifera TaxID=70779 RepID=UPI00077A338B|nr:PREDICTED: G-protein coupled receptor 98-like [Acropora digitifera]
MVDPNSETDEHGIHFEPVRVGTNCEAVRDFLELLLFNEHQSKDDMERTNWKGYAPLHLTFCNNYFYLQTGPVVAAEPSSSQEGTRVIRLSRRAGVLGRVQVSWKITSGPNNGADDFTDTNGVVTFEEGQSLANLSIKVKPDNLPENEETFTLALESPTGGAEIDTNVDEIIISIPANDAPIEFPIDYILVFENQSTVEIDVYRGLESDGITTIGPVSESATVDCARKSVKVHELKNAPERACRTSVSLIKSVVLCCSC